MFELKLASYAISDHLVFILYMNSFSFFFPYHQQISEAEGSTEVTEAPEEEVQNSISERSFEQDQSLPEKAAEQDGLKIASTIEIETEKPEIGETSSHVEEEASAILQNDDELELEAKPEEKTVAETLTNEEITQRLEEVEEPCITHDKEEVSMLFSFY